MVKLGRDAAEAGLRPCLDFLQQAALTHRGDIVSAHFDSGQNSLQHPIKAVEFERAGAAGQTDHWRRTEAAEKQQVAGINRHTEPHDRAARLN